MEHLIKKLASKVGVYSVNLQNNKEFSLNKSDVFTAASVIKLQILFDFYLKVLERKLSLSEKVDLSKYEVVGDSPWVERLSKLQKDNLILEDVAYYMVTESDNTATNIIIDLLGFSSINNTINHMGLTKTEVNRKMCDFEAKKKGLKNLSSPHDQFLFFNYLNNLLPKNFIQYKSKKKFKINSLEDISFEIIRILSESKDLEKIPSGIKDSNILIANKPGELDGIMNDSALIIDGDNRYIISIFSDGVFSEEKADGIISEISKEIFTFLKS